MDDEPATQPAPTDPAQPRFAFGSAGSDVGPGAASAGDNGRAHDAARQLDELRAVLLGPDTDRVEELRARLDDPERRSADVAEVLAEAVEVRTGRDGALGRALAPTMDAAIRESVQRDPGRFADAIFPVIGPAIRRAVADAIQRMMQGVNAAIEHSVSPRGLMWRLEAARTGVPYAQVVLRHTLAYRVEQVLLIHRATGLVLAHASAPGAGSKDPDLVGGMLTALRDFAEDAYGEEEGASLDQFTVGELRVRAAAGPKAIVACAIHGEAPFELTELLQRTVEAIHRRHARDLDRFSGDDAPFRACEPDLRRCLVSQAKPRPGRTAEERAGGRAPVAGIVVLVAALALIGWWAYSSWRVDRAWRGVVAALEQEPGIVVTGQTRGWTGLVVRGLADPLARGPEAVIAEALGEGGGRVRAEFSPFASLEPRLVLARARAALSPIPPGVTIDADADGTLRVAGVAPARWAAQLEVLGAALPGVTRLDASGLSAPDPDALLRSRAEAVLRPPESVVVRAASGTVSVEGEAPGAWVRAARQGWRQIEGALRYDEEGLTNADLVRAARLTELLRGVELRFGAPASLELREGDRQRLGDVRALVAELASAAEAAGLEARVTVVGHSDRQGDPERNEALSLERAAVVRDALAGAGAPVRAVGAGSAQARGGDPADDRRVTFEVDLVPTAASEPADGATHRPGEQR